MRVDLTEGGTRPWFMKLGLRLARWRVGAYPAPPLTISYRRELFHGDLVRYIMRAMAGSGGWSKGEAELFASFVSRLNACHF